MNSTSERAAASSELCAVVLDSGAQDNLDITSAKMLKSLLKELKSKGITVYAAGVHAPVREAAHRMGLFEFISEDHGFPTVDAAVNFLEMSNQSEKD